MQIKLKGEVLTRLILIMRNSQSYHLLLQNYALIARSLSVSEIYITALRSRVIGQAIPLADVPKEIINQLVAQEGGKATVETVFKALTDCGFVEIAAENEFQNLLKKTFRSPYHPQLKRLEQGLLNQTTKTFNHHGRIISLDDVKHMIPKWIPNGTVLQRALHKGMVEIVKFLLPEARDLADKHFLLHSCVRESAFDDERLIQDKISRIQYILQLANLSKINLIDEEFEKAEFTPILQPNIHLDILELLLDSGANINSCTRKNKTILYQTNDKAKYKDVVCFAIANKFNKINYSDSNGLTPLHFAIQEYGVLEHSVLQIFKENGANFNAVDNEDNSILFYALESSHSIEFVDALIGFGASINHVANGGLTAAHVVIEFAWNAGLKWEESMEIINHLVSKGYDGMFRVDSYGLSPFQYMIHLKEIGILLDKFGVKCRRNVRLCELFANGNREILEKILKSKSNLLSEKVFRLWLNGDCKAIPEKKLIKYVTMNS